MVYKPAPKAEVQSEDAAHVRGVSRVRAGRRWVLRETGAAGNESAGVHCGRAEWRERERPPRRARTNPYQPGSSVYWPAEWERPRYRLELKEAAEERGISVDALDPVDELPDENGESQDDDGSDPVSLDLTVGPFTEDDLAVMREHVGEFEEYSPQKRKEVLIEHFRRLTMAGVRFEAPAD